MRNTALPIYLFSKTFHSDVIHIPILSTSFLRPTIDFSHYDAIVMTSKQAVTALQQTDPSWTRLPVLAIGEATSRAVKEAGATLLEFGVGYGENLGDQIIGAYKELRWFYPRPRSVASDFGERVRKAGVQMEEAIVYETFCNPEVEHMTIEDEAVLIFTSPFTIECFEKYFAFAPGHQVVALGKTTASALPEHIHASMPDTPSVEAAVRLARQFLG